MRRSVSAGPSRDSAYVKMFHNSPWIREFYTKGRSGSKVPGLPAIDVNESYRVRSVPPSLEKEVRDSNLGLTREVRYHRPLLYQPPGKGNEFNPRMAGQDRDKTIDAERTRIDYHITPVPPQNPISFNRRPRSDGGVITDRENSEKTRPVRYIGRAQIKEATLNEDYGKANAHFVPSLDRLRKVPVRSISVGNPSLRSRKDNNSDACSEGHLETNTRHGRIPSDTWIGPVMQRPSPPKFGRQRYACSARHRGILSQIIKTDAEMVPCPPGETVVVYRGYNPLNVDAPIYSSNGISDGSGVTQHTCGHGDFHHRVRDFNLASHWAPG